MSVDTNRELTIRPQSNRFNFEVNLGLALPSKFRTSKNYNKAKEHVSLVQSVTEDGSVCIIEIKTQSQEGPLSALDNDVLTVLLSMAWEQRDYNYKKQSERNGYRVYYTLAEICRRLALKEGTGGSVKKSIDRIASQNLKLKNFLYSKSEGKALTNDENTKIILKRGRVSSATEDEYMDDYTSFFYLEFDNYVIKNLYTDYVAAVSTKNYLSLKGGPDRRLFIFLNSKRRIFGDRFTFSLSELSQVLGFDDIKPSKQRDRIKVYLDNISSKLGLFKYVIQKERGRNAWHILIEFFDQSLIEENVDAFYSAIVDYYKEENVLKLDILEADIINYKDEFSSKFSLETTKTTYLFQGQEVDAAELCIDIALFQVIRKRYHLTKTFKALAKAILGRMIGGQLEIPEGYRYFIYTRAESERRNREKEVLLEERKKQEDREEFKQDKLEEGFKDFYEKMVLTHKAQKAHYTKRAEKSLEDDGVSSTDITYNLERSHRMMSFARDDFMAGKAMDSSNGKSTMLLN